MTRNASMQIPPLRRAWLRELGVQHLWLSPAQGTSANIPDSANTSNSANASNSVNTSNRASVSISAAAQNAVSGVTATGDAVLASTDTAHQSTPASSRVHRRQSEAGVATLASEASTPIVAVRAYSVFARAYAIDDATPRRWLALSVAELSPGAEKLLNNVMRSIGARPWAEVHEAASTHKLDLRVVAGLPGQHAMGTDGSDNRVVLPVPWGDAPAQITQVLLFADDTERRQLAGITRLSLANADGNEVNTASLKVLGSLRQLSAQAAAKRALWETLQHLTHAV